VCVVYFVCTMCVGYIDEKSNYEWSVCVRGRYHKRNEKIERVCLYVGCVCVCVCVCVENVVTNNNSF